MPPSYCLTRSTRRNDFAGQGPEELKSTLRAVLERQGIEWGPNKVNRHVVRYLEQVAPKGVGFFDHTVNVLALSVDRRRGLLADPSLARVISYADPTGETAVRNVLQKKGRR